jgi:hypothetical protein
MKIAPAKKDKKVQVGEALRGIIHPSIHPSSKQSFSVYKSITVIHLSIDEEVCSIHS